jgi:hypothetical protein
MFNTNVIKYPRERSGPQLGDLSQKKQGTWELLRLGLINEAKSGLVQQMKLSFLSDYFKDEES